jgi:hypothetical protein
MSTSFKEYLKTRRRSYTTRGDFVVDAERDPNFPDPRRWAELKAYLVRRGAVPEVIQAARSVWRQYMLRR